MEASKGTFPVKMASCPADGARVARGGSGRGGTRTRWATPASGGQADDAAMKGALRLAVTVALAVAALLRAPSARAAPYDPGDGGWEGLRDFVELGRQLLGEARLDVPAKLDVDALGPEDALGLVYPTRPVDPEPLYRFLHRGGRVVLLDDYGGGEPLLRRFDLGRVAGPRDPKERLRDNPALPLARPESAHPSVEGASVVVLNHPTGLTHPNLLPVLAVREASSDAQVVVAVAGAVVRGRLLVVSDASVVTNQMLRYAGNRAFARGLLRYAVDDDSWDRSGTVHSSSGRDAPGLERQLAPQTRARQSS